MRTIKISEECFQKIKEQLIDGKEIEELKDLIGKKFFFRTVTYHLVGEVVKQIGSFLVLENASWIADSGRFMDCIKEGKLNEVEPVGKAYINLDSVVDFFPWVHELPIYQK